MPRYLLVKHYRGGPKQHRSVPSIEEWDAVDIEVHMAFLRHVRDLLVERGEFVDAQALEPERTWVRYGGEEGAEPVTTDGPPPDRSDLIAGWYMVDVASHERALELAAYISSEPGPKGEPLYEWIDVRRVMSDEDDDEADGFDESARD